MAANSKQSSVPSVLALSVVGSPMPSSSNSITKLSGPQSEVETSIADIFSHVLRCDAIKLTDSFFELGGRSLETMALVAAIEARFGVRIHPTSLIESPTVEKLAALVCNPQAQSVGPVVPFRRTGAKLPLFCVHGGNGSALPFRELAKSLGWNQPFYGL